MIVYGLVTITVYCLTDVCVCVCVCGCVCVVVVGGGVRAGFRHMEVPGQPSVVELCRPTLPYSTKK